MAEQRRPAYKGLEREAVIVKKKTPWGADAVQIVMLDTREPWGGYHPTKADAMWDIKRNGFKYISPAELRRRALIKKPPREKPVSQRKLDLG